MDELTTIEICELSLVKVNAIKNKNIVEVGKECIALANFLKCAVELHFNDKIINIYTNTDISKIINATLP